MNTKKVSFYSLGCKVNMYETEAVINEFLDNGFELVDFDAISDVYIINTCSITSMADQKSRKIIREAIKRNPQAIVAVMGCFAQLNKDVIKEINGVDILVGTNNRHMLYPLVIEKLKDNNNNLLDTYHEDILKDRCYEELSLNYYCNRTRGFVKIQDGCDNYCAYCTVPYARGHNRSRDIESIIKEVTNLTNNGMKEIILSGINTGAYGKDKGITLAILLKELVKIPNLGRIRISSIEESEITIELLDVIKENKEHFCNHFHIPLQGGCDNTLKRMKRKYDTLTYFNKINLIRSYFPDANITTDILAGFAGESEEDFNKSVEFLRKIGFGEMHVFPYSRRPKTVAYNYSDQIDPITKKIRVNTLLKVNEELALNYRKLHLGSIVEVIVERINNGMAFGHSSNYLEVRFKANKAKENDLVKVRLLELAYPVMIGEEI